MADNATPADAQAANAGDTSAQAATTTTPDAQAADGQEPITLEEARRLRSEGQALRKRLKAFEDAQAKAEAEKMTETERLQKLATDLQSKYDSDTSLLTERLTRYEVERLAGKLGIIDPDAAAKLIDWETLEFDENGMPTNAEALLKDLLKNKPYLASKQVATTTAGGATNPSRAATTSIGQITLESISKMTAEQYAQLSDAQKAEVTNVLLKRGRR